MTELHKGMYVIVPAWKASMIFHVDEDPRITVSLHPINGGGCGLTVPPEECIPVELVGERWKKIENLPASSPKETNKPKESYFDILIRILEFLKERKNKNG